MGAVAEQWIEDYRRWYYAKRKPGRRPIWLVQLESNADLTTMQPGEIIVVETFND
jgi:hypothetical protein